MDQSATSRSTRQVLSEGESMAVIFEGFGLTGRNWNLTSFIVPVWFVLADSNLVSEFNAGRRSICSVFLMQSVRRADSRADCTAGKSSEMSAARMAITTVNSIRVEPLSCLIR